MRLSIQAENIKSLLQEKLPDTQVEVEGEGYSFQLNLISGELAGQSLVKCQQQVYAHLNAWVANGDVHAVTIKLFSRAV